jgi:hypothetical protein
MTKVYDALRQAEACRTERREAPVSTDVLFTQKAAPVAGSDPERQGGDLDRLRQIMLGSLVHDFEHAVARLEIRLAAEEAELRALLCKLEQRLEDRLVEMDARSCHAQADLRQQIHSHASSQHDAIKQRSADAVRRASRGFEELGRRKLGKAELSAFLGGLARHLEQG